MFVVSLIRRGRLGSERGTLSRLLNGKAGVSPMTALALEDLGCWGTASHWMRMQASYDLAQARLKRASAGRWQRRRRMATNQPISAASA